MTPQPDPAPEKVFSLASIADYHATALEEVARVVVAVLHCSPDERFDFWDLVEDQPHSQARPRTLPTRPPAH